MHKKRPCSICRRWFHPNPRVGDRQRTCGEPSCKAAQNRRAQKAWRGRNPDYFVARRLQKQIEEAEAQVEAGEPLTVKPPPAELARVPWDVAQKAFTPQTLVLLVFFYRLAQKSAQKALAAQAVEFTGGNGSTSARGPPKGE